MKRFLIAASLLMSVSAFAGLTIEDGKAWAKEHNLILSSKYEVDLGVEDHAAPIIVTRDGGLALIGDYTEVNTKGVKVVVLDDKKQIMFTHFFGPYLDNLEAQAIIEDNMGNLYAVMETHDKKDDSDTRERVVKFDHKGKIQWDIALEQKEQHYHRHCNTIVLDEDGKHLNITGTVQPTKEAIQKKEHYRWTATLDESGKLVHEVGEKLTR